MNVSRGAFLPSVQNALIWCLALFFYSCKRKEGKEKKGSRRVVVVGIEEGRKRKIKERKKLGLKCLPSRHQNPWVRSLSGNKPGVVAPDCQSIAWEIETGRS